MRFLVVVLSILATSTVALAQTAQLQVSSSDALAGVPFSVVVQTEGFGEDAPEVSDLVVTGCRTELVNVAPSVSTMITSINGRRTESRRVTFGFQYGVTCPNAGMVEIAPVTVTGGGHSVTTRPGRVAVRDIATTPDMRVEFEIPQRPVWLGESFEVTLDWFLKVDPEEQTFVVPLFEATDWIEVSVPEDASGRRLPFTIGGQTIELPFTQERVPFGGDIFTRVRFRARVTPKQAGTLELGPVTVAARLRTGMGRDRFGFPVARSEMYRAQSSSGTLEVRAPPLAGRPESYSNAVGDAFSLQVSASRTVVKVGEPVELGIEVRGKGRLEGLVLPPLADMGLPPDKFVLPDEIPAGEIFDDGSGKLFRVTVRLASSEVREIPSLALGYFDPETQRYQTARSEPVALSVSGADIVGAGDVVGGAGPGTDDEADEAPRPGALVGVDLALSEPGETLTRARSVSDVIPLVAALYAGPLLLFVGLALRRRGDERGEARSELKQALREVEAALADARKRPARDAAPVVARKLAALGKRSGARDETGLTERLDNLAFDPASASTPVSSELAGEVRATARRWARSARRTTTRGATTMAFLLAGLSAIGAHVADADDGKSEALIQALSEAQESYSQGLATESAVDRRQLFERAATRFGEAARAHPQAPGLLSDWGNAALLAHQRGLAVLAYRRALALEPGQSRARENLAWLRQRLPDFVPVPEASGVASALFFWHTSLSAAHKHVGAAAAFAVLVLLLAPWRSARVRRWRPLAVVPAVMWLALVGSALLEDDVGRAVILVEETPLRTADSPGAPGALSRPLPPGTELEVTETRGGWSRVALADGQSGWLPRARLEPVVVAES